MRLLDDDPVAVAPLLLGAVLHGRGVSVRLTEVEAYRGEGADPGSHAFRGRTPRTEPMFGPAGTIYVYLSYGMHRCLNLVCGPAGEAGACASRTIPHRDLARGPARLATALGIDLADSGGMLSAGPLHLEPGDPVPPERIVSGPRVGVSGPGGTAEYPWRYWLAGDSTVSVYRPAVTRTRSTPAR